MFTRTLQQSLLVASLYCFVAIANAAPIDDADAAYNRGDYAQAIKIWRSLAAQGNAQAQNNTEGNQLGNERLQQDRNKVTSESYL